MLVLLVGWEVTGVKILHSTLGGENSFPGARGSDLSGVADSGSHAGSWCINDTLQNDAGTHRWLGRKRGTCRTPGTNF